MCHSEYTNALSLIYLKVFQDPMKSWQLFFLCWCICYWNRKLGWGILKSVSLL